MFLLPFLLNKAVLISLSLIVVGSGTVFGGIKAGEYRDTQIILQEAQQLSYEGKYQEAIGKLTATEKKWGPKGIKEEVQREIEDNKLLAESSKNYELGKELFDKGSYKDTLEVLKKVDIRNTNYASAKSLIELAESKIAKPKGQVAGITSQAQVKVKASTPIETPAPIPSSTPIPTLTPQPTPAIDPGKTAELKNIVAEVNRTAVIRANATVALNFYQENEAKAQALGQGSIFQSDIDAQIKIISEVDSKKRDLINRANILAAECPVCWEEAKKGLY